MSDEPEQPEEIEEVAEIDIMEPRVRAVFERGLEIMDAKRKISKMTDLFVEDMCQLFPEHLDQIRKGLEGAAGFLLDKRDRAKTDARKQEVDSGEPGHNPGANGVSHSVPEGVRGDVTPIKKGDGEAG